MLTLLSMEKQQVECNLRHTNVSKQRTLLADIDVAPSHGAA